MSRKRLKPPRIEDETLEILDMICNIQGEETEKEPGKIPAPSSPEPPKNPINTVVNSSEYIENRVRELQKITQKIPQNTALESLHEDQLIGLLENATQISMAVRHAYLGGKNEWYESRRETLSGHLPVRVGHPENTVLRISIPPLVGRRFKGSFDVYWNVKISLEEYYSKHERPILTDEKLLLIYKKYAPNLDICYTCDNDNWEAKRVTNAISEALMYSDNAEHFSMMYTAVKSDSDFVEATVIRLQDLPKFASYLTESSAAQPL